VRTSTTIGHLPSAGSVFVVAALVVMMVVGAAVVLIFAAVDFWWPVQGAEMSSRVEIVS